MYIHNKLVLGNFPAPDFCWLLNDKCVQLGNKWVTLLPNSIA